MKRALIVLLIVAAIGAGAGAYYYRRSGPEVQVQTSPITRGDIVDSVGATGTLQAVTTVQVGSQVSGNIQWLGADFNSIVKKGQVIARLDPSLFEAQLQQANANLNQTRANLTKALSDLDRTKVQLVDAQQKYTRAKELAARSLLPQSELDAAKTAVDSAQATMASQQATVTQAQAAVSQSQASVHQNQVNLDHTVIQAPIDGIVTQRSVDVGQTVAASMQAPTLFVIAADLTKMQVNANIDEADVGRIRPGQHVTFRVDAYPTDNFEGTVSQIRLQPVVVQNVTTYGTVIDVPNAQLKLKPGMTANVKVEIARRNDVLLVPNTALRFRPTPELFAYLNQTVPPEAQPGGGRGGRGGNRNAGAGGTAAPNAATPGATSPSVPPAAAPSAATPARAPSASAPSATTGQAPVGFRGDRPPEGGATATGRGGWGGGRGGNAAAGQSGEASNGSGQSGRGGGGRNFDPARMMERFKSMSADEQQQFIARMKDRGQDTSAFEQAIKSAAKSTPSPAASALRPKYGAPASAQTIDALFAPLPSIETRGRAWLFINRQLIPKNLRLGVSDGTNTELLSTELQQGMEVVTGVTGLGTTRTLPGQGNPMNPMMPGGGRGPGGGFGGPGGGGRGR
jgi:HlyD family secretion protein